MQQESNGCIERMNEISTTVVDLLTLEPAVKCSLSQATINLD